LPIEEGGTQLPPLEHRLGYAADLHRGLPAGHHIPAQEFSAPTQPARMRAPSRPISTRF